MSITSFKYNLTFIVLCVGMTLIHAGDEEERTFIKLYYTDWSVPCRAVMMLGKMLNVSFLLMHVDLEKHEQYDPEYAKINPQRTVPTIDDNGFILSESRAILVYLARKYGTGENEKLFPDNGTGIPDDAKQQAEINKMLQFDMGTLGPAFNNLHGLWVVFKTPKTEFKLSKLLGALQLFDTLLKKEYAAGNSLTVADVSLFANIITIEASGQDLSPYKNIIKWYERCKAEITDFEEVNREGISIVKNRTKERNAEDAVHKIEESVSNRDVYTAVSTLLRAVQSQVISTQHLQYLKPLMTDMSSLVKT